MLWLQIAFGITLTALITWPGVTLYRKYLTKRRRNRIKRALSVSSAVFSATSQVPTAALSRDTRRGLVLLVDRQLRTLDAEGSHHPLLPHLKSQLSSLNKIPSGLGRKPIRSKAVRRDASQALGEITELLSSGIEKGDLDARDGELARASARFTAAQLEVETARQAAKDAENMRAYGQALNFAYRAQALARKLPPLMAKSLDEAISIDIERLQARVAKTA